MKVTHFATGFAALLAAAFCSCSESEQESRPNEPGLSDPVLSTNFARVCYDGRFGISKSDTIFFATDNWRLTQVEYQGKAVVADFEGTSPFSSDFGWMRMDYADKQLRITAIERCDSSEFLNFPYQRYARLFFENEGVTDTLVCSQVVDESAGVLSSPLIPGDLRLTKEGGSVTYDRCGFALPLSVMLDSVEFQLNTEQEIFANPNKDYSFRHDWVEVKYFATGALEQQYGIKYDGITVAVAPNNTGAERTCFIDFRHMEEAMYQGYIVRCIQSAE